MSEKPTVQKSHLSVAITWSIVERLRIRFLYSEDCPSHVEALDRLHKVLDEEGVDVNVEIVRVDTFEKAESEHFPGSPTITIDGRDICPIQNPHYAPTCRAYLLEDGRVSPLPPVSMIRRAVRSAKENLKSSRQNW